MALLFARRGRRGLSPLLTLVLGTLAYRSLTRGQGRLAALIGGMGMSGRLGALVSTILQQVVDGDRAGGPSTAQPSAAGDIEALLGEERIKWLMTETGMTRSELLKGLRRFA